MTAKNTYLLRGKKRRKSRVLYYHYYSYFFKNQKIDEKPFSMTDMKGTFALMIPTGKLPKIKSAGLLKYHAKKNLVRPKGFIYRYSANRIKAF